jgi:hypothetical protein
MILIEPTFLHHFFNIAIRELIAPAKAAQNDGGLKVTPLERRGIVLHEQT